MQRRARSNRDFLGTSKDRNTMALHKHATKRIGYKYRNADTAVIMEMTVTDRRKLVS